jgi:hypothetical protein
VKQEAPRKLGTSALQGREHVRHDSLEELRDLLPPGLVKAAPDPSDVPEIEETWL